MTNTAAGEQGSRGAGESPSSPLAPLLPCPLAGFPREAKMTQVRIGNATLEIVRSIDRGIVFLVGFWSGPAIQAFAALTKELAV